MDPDLSNGLKGVTLGNKASLIFYEVIRDDFRANATTVPNYQVTSIDQAIGRTAIHEIGHQLLVNRNSGFPDLGEHRNDDRNIMTSPSNNSQGIGTVPEGMYYFNPIEVNFLRSIINSPENGVD